MNKKETFATIKIHGFCNFPEPGPDFSAFEFLQKLMDSLDENYQIQLIAETKPFNYTQHTLQSICKNIIDGEKILCGNQIQIFPHQIKAYRVLNLQKVD